MTVSVNTDIVGSNEQRDAKWNESDADREENGQHSAGRHDRLPCWKLLLLELRV